MPDILVEETKDYKGGIRIINASNNWVKLISDGTNWIVFRALF